MGWPPKMRPCQSNLIFVVREPKGSDACHNSGCSPDVIDLNPKTLKGLAHRLEYCPWSGRLVQASNVVLSTAISARETLV